MLPPYPLASSQAIIVTIIIWSAIKECGQAIVIINLLEIVQTIGATLSAKVTNQKYFQTTLICSKGIS